MGESHPAKATSVNRTGLRNCLFLKSNNRSITAYANAVPGGGRLHSKETADVAVLAKWL